MGNVELNSARWLCIEDLKGEEWKPVVGYESYYLISNYGRLKSLTRYTFDSKGRSMYHKGKIVKASVSRCGYATFRISVEGKLICVILHRLVADAFIPNHENLPFVHHLDEDKLNNKVSNLGWISNKDNINYKDTQKRHSESLKKSIRHKTYIVKQYDLLGNEMATYRGKSEIIDAGYSYDGVVHCCKGVTRTHSGYLWKRFKPE